MSQTPTLSQPPEPLTSASARVLPPSPGADPSAVSETVERLRAELGASFDRTRQARLLTEIATLEERAGDEPGAARDYLAAYNTDQTFREPLEGLVGLLEKRRSLKNLGKLIDTLVRAAAAPDESARAWMMRAAYQADVAGDLSEAKASTEQATRVEGAPAAERAAAWLGLEVLAGRTGDVRAREGAIAERAQHAQHPTWRALLLADCARIAAAGGEADKAVSLLQEARRIESAGAWNATLQLEALTGERAAHASADDVRIRGEASAEALEATASLIEDSVHDAERADLLGVPQWARHPARLVDAWLRAAEARRLLGQTDRASATLDRAMSYLGGLEGEEVRLAEGVVIHARIRIAEQTGDTSLAAQLAQKRLTSETDPGLSASLALRVAEQAAAQGDAGRAFESLSRAVGSDPACLPARALQFDMLADGSDPSAFAAQLESFADHLATDEARGRSFLLAAYVWGVHSRDVAGAKAALSQASLYGVPPATTARLARALAAVTEDAAWYEEATKRLLAAGAEEREVVSLCVELVRARHARGDAEGEGRALREMAGAPNGGWLARVLEGFLPGGPGAVEPSPPPSATPSRRTAAVQELAAVEKDPELARGLSVVAALRAHTEGDTAGARRALQELADRDPADALTSTILADLARAERDHADAARVASIAAAHASDPEVASALRLEAAFERWRGGDRKGAIEDLEAASEAAPEAARMVLGWAARGVDVGSIDGRRRAIERAIAGGVADARALALEQFATEVAASDPDAASAALARVDRSPDGSLGLAAAIARLAWSQGSADPVATGQAIVRLAQCGPRGLLLAAGERTRIAREAGDPEELARATRGWFEAGGGLPAAIEWLAAATSLGEPREEIQARLAVAAVLEGSAREAVLASAALGQFLDEPDTPPPIVEGVSHAARLMNLELAAPGCDPRRRARALGELDGAVDDETGTDAEALLGWSALAMADTSRARAAFEASTRKRPSDLAAWEGLRTCAELGGDAALRATAAAELGGRCQNPSRAAAFWEEAALLWLELGDESNADRALEESFGRDARRGVAFDKLFRRVRARKDNDKLLGLIARRLEVAEDPPEIQKLFWEQARVLREKGDQDGALKALEHVTMLDPDHVGALALLGEIGIRRGNFEQAADSLARLAALDAAPARNRVTAGVAAVDLFENKLDRHDKALEVLLTLHRAKLSTLPVRERLARAAARTGAWNEATSMLEELMNERADPLGRIEAARLSMTIHRDRLGGAQGAVAAITKLLEESPADGEALDMLLETEQPREARGRLLENARRTLVDLLQQRPTHIASVRRLAKVARAVNDDALQRAALGVLVSLGAGDARSGEMLAKLEANATHAPQIAMGKEAFRGLLAAGDDGPIADLFALIAPTLAEALGPTLQSLGVGRREKVDPRSGSPLRNEVAAWAGAFGVQEFDLYVGGSAPLGVQGVPGEPPALVVGPGILAPLSPIVRGRVAREVLALRRGTTVVRLRDDVSVAAIVVACCQLCGVPIEHPPYAVLAEIERTVGKAIARKTKKVLPDVARAIASRGLDARAWSRRALASLDRVAVLASGDVSVALGELLGVSQDNLAQATTGSPRAEELLRFVLSPEYLKLRTSLGLDGGNGA